ncbi:uncharacterized protein LOC128716386 [Anopheles marshallii]|uniref:uncharacterized protein LOC128716386 n=1 Tax=Anopheles marshallii TaxID=1521116 RepID=UPI00237A2050|nr:uncharacterized protein LOC128716386 [Anopheles marshallii]
MHQLGEQQVEIPLFRTEEGRYLATSLGDPLIKGLTEVANKRPPDPITYLANYLFNFANQKTKTGRKESENDSNNNFIEGAVKQLAEKELESSGKQPNQPEPVQGPVTTQPMEPNVRDESQPSPEEPDIIPAPSDERVLNALIQLIEESGINVTYRDELYRTARDVALQATQPDNAKEIDRYIIGLVAKGRCALHIAILMENEDMVDYLATNFKGALKIGDNLERTPLHYAMGVSNVEALSRILIKNGAKRVLKDLKGRQPSYYFMNKADILRLQEEEKE